jgi:radical SAM protein with 4Fe4S-binding SPASM domain
MTTEQALEIVDELSSMRVNMLAVTGGEPLLRKDLLEVMAHARQKGLTTGIATNGFLVDEEMARKIHQAGIQSVQVSLDGLEETHNGIRHNAKSFQRAIAAIGFLIQHGVPLVSVATTVGPHNFHDLVKLGKVLRSIGVKAWRLTVVMPIGRARDTSLLLNSEQLDALFAFVQYSNRPNFTTYIGENLPFLGAWERRIRKEPLICPIGFTACCIGVDGHVRGCPEQPDTPANREGSLLETPLTEIWQRGFARYRSREIMTIDPRCAACDSQSPCYGGCWVMREGHQHCIYSLLNPPPAA